MRRMRSLCCARATTGHTAAAPPRREMNSRRLIAAPRLKSGDRIGKDQYTGRGYRCPLWARSGHLQIHGPGITLVGISSREKS
jgi:hypothetical protein